MADVTVPGYEVSGVLGQGGFGIVYRARQLAVDREVALKVDNRVLVSERDRRRFMREVTAAGALSGHPHVAHVYDAGVLPDGRPYMVLELCPGGSLADRLRDRLPVTEVRDIGVRIADALAAAHAEGVLHRDVKPANILVNRYGNVALSDFGLATMPSSGEGGEVSVTRESLTPAYAPPEAFQLTEPTEAGDVYSLSATVYALLFGRPPRFPESGGVTISMIMALHRLPIPDIPGVPPQLTAVLRHGMAADPRARIPTAAALRDALRAVDLEYGAAPPAPGQGPPPPFAPSGQPSPAGPPSFAPAGAPSFAPSGAPTGYPPAQPYGSRQGGRQLKASMTAPGIDHVLSTRSKAPANPATKLYAVAAAVFVLLLLAGAALLVVENFPGAGAQPEQQAARITGAATAPATEAPPTAAPSPASTGTKLITVGCPAAVIKGSGCVERAECWGGIVAITGQVSVKRIACEESHVWETFAVAPIPADAETNDLADLEKHPTVRAVCSRAVLLASRTGRARSIGDGRWRSSVLPPTAAQFAAGVREYRCVGGVLGQERPGTYFRPA